MQKFDPSNSEISIFTYKEGLLSAMAHDLKIGVTDFIAQFHPDQKKIQATIKASSLRVINAMKSGQESPGTLSDSNKQEIEASIVKDVLHSQKYPEITFDSTYSQSQEHHLEVNGTLSLHGQNRLISFTASKKNDQWEAQIKLNQPDFGIKPYTAMFGTLKVQPELLVIIRIPSMAQI